MLRLRNNAGRRGIYFNLTIDDLKAAWPTDGRCPVFGYILRRGRRTRKNSSPSVDRVKNSAGYRRGNVRVISNRANLLKSDATIAELRRVIEYMEGRL